MTTTKKRLTDDEIIQEVLKSSQDDYDIDSSELDHSSSKPDSTTIEGIRTKLH